MHNFNQRRKEPLQFIAWTTGILGASVIFFLTLLVFPHRKLPANYSLENEAHASLKTESPVAEVCSLPEMTNIEKFAELNLKRDFHPDKFSLISAEKKGPVIEKKFSVEKAHSNFEGKTLTGAILLAPSVNLVDGVPYAAEWRFEFSDAENKTTTLVMFSDESKQNESMQNILMLQKSHSAELDLNSVLTSHENHFYIPEVSPACGDKLVFAKALISLSGAQVDRVNLISAH